MRIISFCMDTKKDAKIPQCGELDRLNRNRLVVGAKQIRKALDKGVARSVFLAKNADPEITGPLEAKCQFYHVSCTWVANMDALGKACGIDVGATAAAAVE